MPALSGDQVFDRMKELIAVFLKEQQGNPSWSVTYPKFVRVKSTQNEAESTDEIFLLADYGSFSVDEVMNGEVAKYLDDIDLKHWRVGELNLEAENETDERVAEAHAVMLAAVSTRRHMFSH